MSSLSSDIIAEILRRADGTTLATAASSSSTLKSIAFQEWLWEDLCSSLWPSTQTGEIKQLISSLGGFRKFYGYCFPLLNVCWKHPTIDFKEEYQENFNVAEEEVVHDAVPVSPDDMVTLLDIHFNNKSIYSKVISADGMSHFHRTSCSFFQTSPFHIDLLCNGDGINMPSILIDDIEKEKGVDSSKIFQVQNMMRLSWIIINTRTKRAVNLSSWRPLQARRTFRSRGNEFTIRFGSILPADHNAMPLDLIACNIMVRCRSAGGETMNLQINEISIQMEDVVGNQMNVREGALAIERAMKWEGRSKEHDNIIETCRQVLEIHSEYDHMKEQEQKVQAVQPRMIDPLYLLFPFAAMSVFYCYCFM
ncbi:hypothetical protein KI387_019294 [Taxus chinensis]|uniref:F-box protein n=1 Tax=Taxus chinensis TaxID=29808 RepID=A0AA38LDG6_TAXCH|nr:hypothetical protein KI387_019294 [Taxus chinensis]